MAKKILIVDDSTSLRTVVKMALVGAGYEVVEASDGNAALDVLSKHTVNMIVSDVNMPGMGGLEFCAKAKQLPAVKYIPILMLTTEATDEKKALGRAAGAAGWLCKPFAPSALLNAVSKLAK